MDANKLAKLREIEYRIPKTCGLCDFSSFAPSSEWGECINHEYDHLKHANNPRFLSIYRGGTCKHFVMSDCHGGKLDKFQEFVR